jgi:hypothetical protein
LAKVKLSLSQKTYEDWLSKGLADHKHKLDAQLEATKNDLKYASDLALEVRRNELKRESDLILAKVARDTQQRLLEFQSQLLAASSSQERIREEIEHWANPILDAVEGLEFRLNNILFENGDEVLSNTPKKPIPLGWSITNEYFISSTVFLFAQYFCYVRQLRERLRFDLFSGQCDGKDSFLNHLRAVDRTLSDWPLRELGDLPLAEDRQIFNLQQRAIGEAMTTGEGDAAHCIGYSMFMDKWKDESFKSKLAPLLEFLENLRHDSIRGKRLGLMLTKVKELKQECRRILGLGNESA